MNEVLILIYGVLDRSLRFTHINHDYTIFNQLNKLGYTYKVCYVNNDIQESLIDNHKPGSSVVKRLYFDDYVEYKQTDIDNEIYHIYSPQLKPKSKREFIPPGFRKNINCFRQSFIETKCAEYLISVSNKFTHCMVFCADLWFGSKLTSLQLPVDRLVKIGSQNRACGLTNGFYSGPVRLVSKLIDSFSILYDIKPPCYERIIHYNAKQNNIPIKQLGLEWMWLKIRNTGKPAYQNKHRGRFRPQWIRTKHLLSSYNEYKLKIEDDDKFKKS